LRELGVQTVVDGFLAQHTIGILVLVDGVHAGEDGLEEGEPLLDAGGRQARLRVVIPALLNRFTEDRERLMLPPGLLELWSHLSMHHQIAYFLESWMGRGLGLEGQLVGGDRPDISAPRRNLPEHQAARVHVDAEEGVAGEIDGSLQHLGGHITSGAHLPVGVTNDFVGFELEGETKVPDAGRLVGPDEHVLGLEVAVGDGRLDARPPAARDLRMQMRQACSNAKADFAELVHADGVALEVVAQRAVLVERRHQPEFHLQILPSLIHAYEFENIFV